MFGFVFGLARFLAGVRVWAICVALLTAATGGGAVLAGEAPPAQVAAPQKLSNDLKYIKKIAEGGAYNVLVIGDSLGAGLWQGLQQNFRADEKPAVTVMQETRTNTGIARSDRFDWVKNVEQLAGKPDFQIAILMFGANDAQTIREDGKYHHFKTPGWEAHYRKRIDRMIAALKEKQVAVYWVGLPNVRDEERRADYLHFNAIFKERAQHHDVRFVDTWNVTNDEEGRYQASGKAVDGRKTLLRAQDGTHFTADGYRVLALYPEKILREDMTTAQTLAHAAVEQKKPDDS